MGDASVDEIETEHGNVLRNLMCKLDRREISGQQYLLLVSLLDSDFRILLDRFRATTTSRLTRPVHAPSNQGGSSRSGDGCYGWSSGQPPFQNSPGKDELIWI